MKKKIFSAIFFVTLVVILLITGIVTYNFYDTFSATEITQLKNESQLVIKGVEEDGIDYFDGMSFDNYRITWIESDGTVIYDSQLDSADMENHLQREEVQDAIATGYGESRRYSNSIMQVSYYVAYLLEDSSIIRLSCTQSSIFYLILKSLYPLYIVASLAFIASLILAITISNKIVDPLNKLNLEHPLENKIYPEISPLLERMDYQHEQLIKEKKEVEKASLIRQEFTANVSHELKTPLHIISGYSELIEDGIARPDDIKDFAGKINKESKRMTKLVEDIMELSKLDSGATGEKKSDVDLLQLCKNVIDSLQSFAEEKNITINSELTSVKIYGISDVLHSIVYNLIDNAIKYNKENGKVYVRLYQDSKIHIEVKDTGIGIPDDQLDRIFERFYRVDKSHSKEIGGTGLGLSIVKHAVLIHNGSIKVESKINEGTTFKITF